MPSFLILLKRKIRRRKNLYFWLLLLKQTYFSFGRDGCSNLAAGISYYALLSVFPIILIGISILGYRIGQPEAIENTNKFLTQFLPGYIDLVMNNVKIIAKNRGATGIIGIFALMWTGRGLFLAMEQSLNRVWGAQFSRSTLGSHLVSFFLIFAIGLVLAISMVVSAASAYVLNIKVPVLNISLSNLAIIAAINKLLLSTILIFVIFMILFKVLPHTRVSFKSILPGAIFSTILWKIAELSYIWYLANMAKLTEIYGSIGGLIGLMLWFFIAAEVFLFGTEFNIAYFRLRRKIFGN